MIALRAAALAPAARDWLKQARPARVLNVFGRAINLVNDASDVLAIVTHERGMTPFGLALEPTSAEPFRYVAAASPVYRQPGELVIGDVRIAWSGAQGWNPLPNWDAVRAALASYPSPMDELTAIALYPTSGSSIAPSAASPPPASLLELYAPQVSSALPPPLAERIRTGAAGLVTGLHVGDEQQAILGAHRLAGAGGGLTPAGDDFAIGVFLAARAGLYHETTARLSAHLAEAMAPRTTLLSAAYLRAAARGECAAPWHTLFAALLEPHPARRQSALAAAVAGLFAVGHTSGADGLAGFLSYNQAVFRRSHENPA